MKKKVFIPLAFILCLIPFAFNIPLEVKKGLSILIFTAVLWITEALPLPVTSLLVPILASLLGVLSVKAAFSSFAHPIIFLFFGGFALATALKKYEMDKFIAYKIVSASKGSLFTTSLLLFAATAFVSMWISNTSTTAMMLPLALGIIGAVQADSRLKTFILLGIAYSASVGGIGTLVGSPPNGITAANLNMSFTDWLTFGIPTVIVLFPLLFLILYLYFKPNLKEKVTLEKFSFLMTKERWTVLGIFILTALLWLFGKKISSLFGIHHYFDALVAVFAVVLLFLTNLVNWEEINEGTDWGTLYLFGGGIALSHVLKTTGASKFIASLLTESIGNLPHLLIVLCVTLFMIFMTELMSNTATAAIFIPILITAATQMGLPPHELALPAGIAASCAFMLPVATPPNAIVYGTGAIKQKDMLKVGFILNIAFAIAITLLTVFIINRTI
ncbi:solute carrier family 13 (sodium-dependent dicarboxylate transporter), member 2/3/5 [Desulfurobacterium pacificum]|uniref:Solute carrier family 13 (Sodium-dependent dicarboxylate transporter), member 2/3/5 n=1 Tax=Desulfurobacterium pacificum TaxID=240166 RepID=A0ABY1NI31_9BACT|nr:DASS family sodium-coupled anion symporter [Desulfurobacterium pacificum]SMP10264.1 solute carrier family 13 (sodium-dependent dicarboxylate transporter), member 2/3/5 [Desulfurobacterium pacificum]